MSCSTLNQQLVRMTVSAGALPEGFCPQSWQDAFDSIVQRIIVTPNQAFTSFAAGSVEPTSNVGPWFKDCEEFFIWDDATSRYIPMQKGGFDNEQYFSASGTFTVPDFIYKIRVSLWGAGGGGFNGASGGGGGGGAFVKKIFTVTPGQSIAFIIGSGGASGSPAANGTNSTFLTLVAGGGTAGVTGPGGAGGLPTGGDINFNGGHGKEGFAADPGQGGSSPQGGSGGVANSAGTASALAGVAPGGGGTGAAGGINVGGPGANGGLLVEW